MLVIYSESFKKSFENKFIAEPNSGCWLWTGETLGKKRYGRFRKSRAHRVSFEIYNNKKIPSGLVVCHKCDTPECVNPMHLFVGTQKENVYDAISKKRFKPFENKKGKNLKLNKECIEHLLKCRKAGVSVSKIAKIFSPFNFTTSSIFLVELSIASISLNDRILSLNLG